jgi:hypothetical protein
VRNIILAMTAALALFASGALTPGALADEAPPVRHAKRVHHACTGPHCGPYQPCGARCRIVCPDGYSCAPLYGAYGPYGGVGYWGGYTFSGWGR